MEIVKSDEELIFDSIKNIPYLICESFKGKDILEVKYHQLWEDAPLPANNPENAFRIISGDFVTTDEGTGIVHTSPTFGADDALAAKNASPEVPPMLVYNEAEELVPLVDLQGKFLNSLKGINKNLMLHSYEIKFIIRDKKYTYKALLPDYFKKLLKTKRLNFSNLK